MSASCSSSPAPNPDVCDVHLGGYGPRRSPVVALMAEGAAPQELFGLRQQLRCSSKELLEAAADRELERLDRFRMEALCMRADAAFLAEVDQRIAALQLARRQLAYLYIDQFAAGRAENDSEGRYGLQRPG